MCSNKYILKLTFLKLLYYKMCRCLLKKKNVCIILSIFFSEVRNSINVLLNTPHICFRHADLNHLASSVQEMKNKLSYLKKTASDVNKIKTVGLYLYLVLHLPTPMLCIVIAQKIRINNNQGLNRTFHTLK